MIAQQMSGPQVPEIAWTVALLAAMALTPFLLAMVTAFAKIVIVAGLLRQALGTAQIPPTSVLTGLALVLTIHVMMPVAQRIHDRAGPNLDRLPGIVLDEVDRFLAANAGQDEDALFASMAKRQRRSPHPEGQVERALHVLTVRAPAFMLTELRKAFSFGFLLFVPFLVIDLVVGNVLMAMGMIMLSPTTVSLPLKLALFVVVDGWKLLLEGLVTGYATS